MSSTPKYLDAPSNFDKHPATPLQAGDGEAFFGYADIAAELGARLSQGKGVVVVDCYVTTRYDEIIDGLSSLEFDEVIVSDDIFDEPDVLQQKLERFITDDRVFGFVYPFGMDYLLDQERLEATRRRVAAASATGRVLVIGVGAQKITAGDALVYAAIARWEIQMRYRYGKLPNFRADNAGDDLIRKYKRGYFVDWRFCDDHKRKIVHLVDYFLDTNVENEPKMLSRALYRRGLATTVSKPFRVVPYFDEGLWGGHWMEEVCGVHDERMRNLAWSYTCLLEENSLYLDVDGTRVELPSVDLAYFEPLALLGERTFARFGGEFPIRFDFLDTMGGGNLSLQVHPNADYMYRTFGLNYTQEESYYLLDCVEGEGSVYLGLKEGYDKDQMIADLRAAQSGAHFDDTRYANNFPVRKHDHLHIPQGTVHCSSINTMVLEISSAPCIFTFKLWDWGRVGLDGVPRPTHVDHGVNNIRWDRTTKFFEEECVNQITPVGEGDGYREESTGLERSQFIETRRHWFTKPVLHKSNGEFAVLNLVQGREAVVSSPTGAFDDFVVHFAETFILPAGAGDYVIAPHGESEGQELATIKAFVRFDEHGSLDGH